MRARVSEASIQSATIDHWRACGLPDTLVAAIPNQKAFGQAGLCKGLFDLLVIGGRVGVGFLELKTEAGKLRHEQKTFRDLLIVNGISYAVTYGRDEPIRMLEDWGVVRKQARAVA
ncbi:hypothetical protein [Microvirga sp. P5_D2]